MVYNLLAPGGIFGSDHWILTLLFTRGGITAHYKAKFT